MYSKHIPDWKKVHLVTPVGNGWFAYGTIRYLKSAEILFLEKNGLAIQITKPKRSRYQERNDLYKIDKHIFLRMLGGDHQRLLEKTGKKKLKPKRKEDLIQLIELANSF